MSAEQQLLDALKQYEEGVYTSVKTTIATGQMDQISAMITQEVSSKIPGAGQAIQAADGIVQQIAANSNGPFAGLVRSGNNLTNFGLVGFLVGVFSGRTFNTDQYWGAVYYQRYVLGKSVNNENQIADKDVAPALKWFEDKLGVFISGREHLEALQKSAQDYINYYGVNNYTTIDTTRVNNAVAVMKTYMPLPGFSQPPGIWAGTVGVYDAALVGLVTGSTAYQSALNGAKQTYTQTDNLPAGTVIGGIPDLSQLRANPVYVGAGILLLILILLLL